ncbi:MAG TPA: response regulator [Bryobacteraceae bacterium]|nr:response regulator [Bryobacteraceae bacterium]
MAKVLVVDDDADSRELLAKYLRNSGHRVALAPNGSDALAALTVDTPDVVVLDYKMPQMDGVSFLEVIRCYLRWQSLPVILLTAYPDGPHIRRGVELGIRKTFLKSDFDLADLATHVATCSSPAIAGGPDGPSESPYSPFQH